MSLEIGICLLCDKAFFRAKLLEAKMVYYVMQKGKTGYVCESCINKLGSPEGVKLNSIYEE
jgi:hypothetical protein